MPGSEEVASSKKINFLQKALPQAAKLPGTSGFFKKVDFLRKVLPQAAKLPGTSGLLKKNIFRNSSAPGSEAAGDKWFVQKKLIF